MDDIDDHKKVSSGAASSGRGEAVPPHAAASGACACDEVRHGARKRAHEKTTGRCARTHAVTATHRLSAVSFVLCSRVVVTLLQQRTRVLAVKGAPAAGQSRYAAETAGGDSDGDSDDEAATATQTRKGGGGGGKKKKRRDEDDDDEDDVGPPPQADSDMQRLMQQYKEQPKNNGRGSTLMAANRHAQTAKRAQGHTSPLQQQQGGGDASVVALRPPPKKRVNLATLLKDSDTDDVGGEDEGAEAEGAAGATLPVAFAHPRRSLTAQHNQGIPAPLRQRWSNNEEQPPFSDRSDVDVHGEFEGGVEGEGQMLHGAYNEDVEALEAGPAFQLQPRKKEQKDQSLRELPVIQPPTMGQHRSPSLHDAAAVAAAADEGAMMSMPGQIDSHSGDEDCEGEGGVSSSQDLDGQTPVHGHGAPGAGNKGFAKSLAGGGGGGGGGGSLFVSHHSAHHSQSTTHMLDEGTGTSVHPTRNNSTNQRSPHNYNQNQLSPLNHNFPQFQTHSPLANGHAFNNQRNQGRTMAAVSGEDEFAF